MTSPALRERYLGNSVSTASPGRLLVMLYQRLVRDLTQAEMALRSGEPRDRVGPAVARAGHRHRTTRLPRPRAWDGAGSLAKIYGFLLGELIAANIQADPDRAASCRDLVTPLVDAWQQALVDRQSSDRPAPGPIVGRLRQSCLTGQRDSFARRRAPWEETGPAPGPRPSTSWKLTSSRSRRCSSQTTASGTTP